VQHNFHWHERWTWRERAGARPRAWRRRCLAFHLGNGLVSLAGNLIVMTAAVGALGMPPVRANLVAIAACWPASFLVADRLVWGCYSGAVTGTSTLVRRAVALGLACAACGPAASAAAGAPPAELKPETLEAWHRYVRAAEARIERDLQAAAKSAPAEAGDVSGEIVIARVAGETADGGVQVPSGTVHHWRGRVFLEGATLDDVTAFIADPERLPAIQDDVVAARVLERGPGRLRLYLRLVRKAIVTVTYDTEYDVAWGRVAPRVAFSRSIATRVAEIDNPGTPRERARAPGDDHGYLWRLNAYWRYEQTDRGVVATLESLSLSRGVPFILSPVVRPIVDRIARESVRRALDALRKGVAGVRRRDGQAGAAGSSTAAGRARPGPGPPAASRVAAGREAGRAGGPRMAATLDAWRRAT
jgi:hypothetical protein